MSYLGSDEFSGENRMDPDQLGRLIDRHARGLALFARQWCDCAEDVVQEAFLKLVSERSTPRDPAAWLYRTVKNSALNAGRSERRRRIREQAAAAERPAWFESPRARESRGTAIDPEEACAQLADLPDREREVIIARIWGELSFEQIGAVLGGSSSSVHRLYQSGMQILRERLGAESCPKTEKTRS